jgi:hypothetical protein
MSNKGDNNAKRRSNPFKPVERLSAVLLDESSSVDIRNKHLLPGEERSRVKRHCNGREFHNVKMDATFSGASGPISNNSQLSERLKYGGHDSAVARLEKSVLGGLTWCTKCQHLGEDMRSGSQTQLVERIPVNFNSSQQYVSVFEPLLHEEARAGIQVWVSESCLMSQLLYLL